MDAVGAGAAGGSAPVVVEDRDARRGLGLLGWDPVGAPSSAGTGWNVGFSRGCCCLTYLLIDYCYWWIRFYLVARVECMEILI